MASPLDTAGTRGRMVLARLGYGLASVLVFALGSIGAFMVLTWPPTLRTLLLGYLLAFLILRLAMALARFLFAPHFPALPGRAHGRRRRQALVPVGGQLRLLVRVRLRHHQPVAPLRRGRDRGPAARLPARPRSARDRPAPGLAHRGRHAVAHRRDRCRGPDLPDLDRRGQAGDVGADRGVAAAAGGRRRPPRGRASVPPARRDRSWRDCGRGSAAGCCRPSRSGFAVPAPGRLPLAVGLGLGHRLRRPGQPGGARWRGSRAGPCMPC